MGEKGRVIGRVISVNVGVARMVQYKGKRRPTAIWKTPFPGRVLASGVNLEGDDQADRKFHGGPRKAIYAYGVEDYEWWEEVLGARLGAGTFGENLTVEGLDFNSVVTTERWAVGGAVLQVTQPRVPCWKLGVRMDDRSFPRRFLEAARTGTYLSIVQAGDIGAGDEILLLQRPQIPLTIGLLATLNFHDPKLSLLLMQLAEQQLPASEWPPLIEAAEQAIRAGAPAGLPEETSAS